MSLITTKKFYQLLILIFLIFATLRTLEILKINRANRQEELHYSNLEKLLSTQDWEKADYETSLLMEEITNQQRYPLSDFVNFITLGQFHQKIIIDDISCKDLLKIDSLWTKYSENRLGFSVQRKILNTIYYA